jgi:hypothetical protein
MEISSPRKDKLMRSNEMARSNDGNASSMGAEHKFATAKPKPWEREPYNYEEQKNAGSSLRCDPRRDYVEQNHGLHQDLDFTPSDDDGYHGFGPSVFGTTPDLSDSASFTSELGTLAGTSYGPSNQEISNWFRTRSKNEQSDYNAYANTLTGLVREGYNHSYAKSTAAAVYPKGAEVAKELDLKFSTTSTQYGESSQSQDGKRNLAHIRAAQRKRQT